ncbi:MAG: hypothetical protein EOO50_15465 [Flavobacterium sp.]|uniref:hypothetical protein n=1 Tax=Flavobacterium sp. TaxID=239 RepID=UPI00120D38D1|nr:hypothetical protein [Flavobacterium sp.]RZJ64519.1 MAG: hypothetical protein EOO50_15465 [Flavobacterium sp.]
MKVKLLLTSSLLVFIGAFSFGQSTQIRGFIDVTGGYNKKATFGFGEQDLYITSAISDRISFLGETVFKYDSTEHTEFAISIERVIITYNLEGNHNLVMGKIHTPLNYWNDTYHHGRVLFPTIDRPLLFSQNIIPLHTVGLGFEGRDLGKMKFGYNLFVGNGLGSSEVSDNDKNKSVTAAVHIKPADRLRLGMSYYYDVISAGADVHGMIVDHRVNQHLISASVSRFGKKLEILAEATSGINHTDTTGTKTTFAGYAYAGYKIKEKYVPYVRYDNVKYQNGEMYYMKNNTQSFVVGFRYEINYLAVVKLEYQHLDYEFGSNVDKITAQFAIGF